MIMKVSTTNKSLFRDVFLEKERGIREIMFYLYVNFVDKDLTAQGKELVKVYLKDPCFTLKMTPQSLLKVSEKIQYTTMIG